MQNAHKLFHIKTEKEEEKKIRKIMKNGVKISSNSCTRKRTKQQKWTNREKKNIVYTTTKNNNNNNCYNDFSAHTVFLERIRFDSCKCVNGFFSFVELNVLCRKWRYIYIQVQFLFWFICKMRVSKKIKLRKIYSFLLESSAFVHAEHNLT